MKKFGYGLIVFFGGILGWFFLIGTWGDDLASFTFAGFILLGLIVSVVVSKESRTGGGEVAFFACIAWFFIGFLALPIYLLIYFLEWLASLGDVGESIAGFLGYLILLAVLFFINVGVRWVRDRVVDWINDRKSRKS